MLAAPRRQAARRLAFHNLHTGEELETTYWRNGYYVPAAIRRINWILRDFRVGRAISMDMRLLDLLHRLDGELDARGRFQIISGYRSPQTNRMLRVRSGGVAKHSLHIVGRAVDIRLPDYGLADLRDAAMALRMGGVGYYPRSAFVHVDTGRVRHWGY
ncbi:MAG TPA: DUF882 domain-containing protein [Gammaproteobacteria bacterium]|nr:DUF882 domain-containing protein [Gammaproteobacteria bacterium]